MELKSQAKERGTISMLIITLTREWAPRPSRCMTRRPSPPPPSPPPLPPPAAFSSASPPRPASDAAAADVATVEGCCCSQNTAGAPKTRQGDRRSGGSAPRCTSMSMRTEATEPPRECPVTQTW